MQYQNDVCDFFSKEPSFLTMKQISACLVKVGGRVGWGMSVWVIFRHTALQGQCIAFRSADYRCMFWHMFAAVGVCGCGMDVGWFRVFFNAH